VSSDFSKERKKNLEEDDYIDPTLPEEIQEIKRRAIAYRKSKNYYKEDGLAKRIPKRNEP